MATLKQRTSFGPGIYRGHQFSRDRLKAFVDGTNAAIAAGVPIPLLKRHAPINASDDDTAQFAKEEGAGWLTKVELEPDTGAIAWEAKDVPEDVVQQANAGTLRFTSPEFRSHYECEKEGVYTGPVIRHWAFTPKPGNPHQGEISTLVAPSISLQEIDAELSANCLQFSEEDFEGGQYGEGITSEDTWEKAKSAAGPEGKKYKGDHYWAVVSSIYKKMGGKYRSKKNPKPHASQHSESLGSIAEGHGWKHVGKEGEWDKYQHPDYKGANHRILIHHPSGSWNHIPSAGKYWNVERMSKLPSGGDQGKHLAAHLEAFHKSDWPKSSQHNEPDGNDATSDLLEKHGWNFKGDGVFTHPKFPKHKMVYQGPHIEHHQPSGSKYVLKDHLQLQRHLNKLHASQHAEMDKLHQQATSLLQGVHKEHAKNLYAKGWRISKGNKWKHATLGEHDMADAVLAQHKASQHAELNKPEPLVTIDSTPDSEYTGLNLEPPTHEVPNEFAVNAAGHSVDEPELVEVEADGGVPSGEDKNKTDPAIHEIDVCPECGSDSIATSAMGPGLTCQDCLHYWEREMPISHNDSQHGEEPHSHDWSAQHLENYGWKPVSGPTGGHTRYENDRTHKGHYIHLGPSGQFTHHGPYGVVGRGTTSGDLKKHLQVQHSRSGGAKIPKQYAEDKQPPALEKDVDVDKQDGVDNIDSAAETTEPTGEKDKAESPPLVEIDEKAPENPDMPPKATDKSKLAAIIAGLNQLGIVVPSDWDPCNDGAMDILLGCLNTHIKTEQDTTAEAEPEEEPSGTPQDAPMPFAEESGNYATGSYGGSNVKTKNSAFKKLVKAHKGHVTSSGIYGASSFRIPTSKIHEFHKAAHENGYFHPHAYKMDYEEHYPGSQHEEESDPQFAESNHHDVLTKRGYQLKYNHGDYHTYAHPQSGHSVFVHGKTGRWSDRHGAWSTSNKLDKHLSKIKHFDGAHNYSQHDEEVQFTEEELAAMPEKARKVILAGQAALAAERQAKEEAQAKALAFAEAEAKAKNDAAKAAAVASVTGSKLPPVLKKQLLASYETTQFSESKEPPKFTAVQVAKMVAASLPPALQFLEGDVKHAEKPKASKPAGRDPVTNEAIFKTEDDSEQFFEDGGALLTAMKPERANEIANATVGLANRGSRAVGQPGYSSKVQDVVHRLNLDHPNDLMKD
jgi:hypothetical protein